MEEIIKYKGWEIIYNGISYRVSLDDKIYKFDTIDETYDFIEKFL